ncbi:MAG: hypothetical protein L0H93_03605 [Nocardioides sp.]|nr:hypothetical protein [Nocardioides sp.]
MAEAETRSGQLPKRGMTPLQKVAMGLIIVAVDSLSRYDTLPDPIGWALVLWGLATIPVPQRPILLYAAGLAGAVSLALWFPQVHEPIHDAELALKWATALPDLLFIFVMSRALQEQAHHQRPPDRKFAGRFGLTMWAAVVVAVLPALADAADSDQMLSIAEISFVILWIWLIWNLFAAHNRRFAGGPSI